MGKHVSDPRVVANWEAAQNKHAYFKAKMSSAKTLAEKIRYQEFASAALKECAKWYNKL